MARPRKNNAERFSHDSELRNNRKVKAVRQKFGLQGYAVFLMLLETLTDAEDFKIADTEEEIELLSGDFDVDVKLLKKMFETFFKIDLIQKQDGFIINHHLVERLSPLLQKRSNMREKYEASRKKPTKKPDGKGGGKPPKKKTELMTEEDRNTFWLKYPVKKDKAKAYQKFLKLQKKLLPVIMQGIEAGIKSSDRIRGYAPHPTTFLNGKRREDDFSSTTANDTRTQSQTNGQNQKSGGNQMNGKVSQEGSADFVVDL